MGIVLSAAAEKLSPSRGCPGAKPMSPGAGRSQAPWLLSPGWISVCDHWRNQSQVLQDLHNHKEMCVTTGNNWEKEMWRQLDCNFGCRHFSRQAPKSYAEFSPRFRGQQLHYEFFLRVSALKLLRAGTFIIYRTAGLFITEENQEHLLIH